MKKYITIIITFWATISLAQNTTNYQYDNFSRLTKSENSSTTQQYYYDELGNRIQYTSTSEVVQQTDLTVKNLSIPANSIEQGTTLLVSCDITNLGNYNATGTYLKVYLSATANGTDIELANKFVSTISANGSVTMSFEITIPQDAQIGSKYLLFYADASDILTETNENNNKANSAVMITSPTAPDLYIQNPLANPISLQIGENIVISANIQNIGNENAGNFWLRCYLSLNPTYESFIDTELGDAAFNFISLNTGANSPYTTSITIPTTTTPGNYYLLFVADTENTINELNENNNIAYTAININNPATAGGTVPTTSFSANNQFISIGTTVQFFDASENNPTSWQWSFPGGTPSYSTQQNPTVTYSNNGTYDVTLTTSNINGSDTHTSSDFVTVGGSSGNSTNWQWAYSSGSSKRDEGNDIFIDKNGYIYVVGEFKGQINFGGIVLTNDYSRSDMFFVKYDNNNNVIFAKQTTGSNGRAGGNAIVVDDIGNIYIIGNVKGTLNLGNGVSISADTRDEDIFLAKFNSNGTALWCNHIGNNEYYNGGFGITTDNTNKVYITGVFTGSNVNFGNGHSLTSTESVTWGYQRNPFIAKYDENGVCLWAKSKLYATSAYGYNISTGTDNDVYFSSDKSLLAKFNATSGEEIWDITGNGGDNYYSNNVIHTYVSGTYRSFDTNGNLLTEKTINTLGGSVKADNQGYIYIAGQYEGTVNIDEFELVSNGDYDMFSAKFDSELNAVWVQSAGSPERDFLNGIALHSDNLVYCTGTFKSNSIFGNHTTVSNGIEDFFIAKHGNLTCPTISPQIQKSANTKLCSGESINLSINQNYESFLWSNGETKSAISVNQSGEFFVEVTDANGCAGISDTVKVTVFEIPEVELSANGTTNICEGNTVELIATTGTNLTYRWLKNGEYITGEISDTYYAKETGDYQVEISNNGKCTSTSEILRVNVEPTYAYISIIADKPQICDGETLHITVQTDNEGDNPQYQWQINGVDVGTNSTSFSGNSFANNDEVTCVLTASGNCISNNPVVSNTFTVQVNPLPIIELGENQNICEGETAIIDAGTHDTYLWNNGSTSQVVEILEVGSADYYVTVTDTNGCQNTSDTVTVEVFPLPNPVISGAENICYGDTITLQTENFETYLWSNGATTQSIEISEIGANDYSVTVTDANACTATSESINVEIYPLPESQITRAENVCYGDTITLQTENFERYLWSNGATTQSIEISEIGASDYSVTVTDANACTATSEIVNVEIYPLPEPQIIGAEDVCASDNGISYFTINETGHLYYWNITGGEIISGQNTNQISVEWNNSGYGTIAVTETIETTGCVNTTPDYLITINPLPIVNLGEDINTNEIPVELDAGEGFENYQWSTGENTQMITLTEDGDYAISVFVTDVNGCQGSDEINVVIATGIGSLAELKSEVKIYPNPNNGIFNYSIIGEYTENYDIRIFNSQGKEIYQNAIKNIQQYEGTIDISSFSYGTYYMKISTESGIKIMKILLTK